jgi:hypothetical protein
MVSELIDQSTGRWNEPLVKNTFWEDDVKIILATPIRDDFEDYPAWHYDEKGTFSVKSAYRLYVTCRDGLPASTSIESNQEIQWKKIWSLTCQPKVKQFIWRLTHNSLPLRINIKRRGIECDTRCVCCKRLDENGAHLFLKCKEVNFFWRNLQLEEIRDQMCTCRDAKSVVQKVLEQDEEKSTLICCMLWSWWWRRNKINAGETAGTVDNLVYQIKHLVNDSLQFCRSRGTTETEKNIVQWSKPEGEWLKINTDGSFMQATREGGWGFVVRDSAGEVRGSGAGYLANTASAAHAEAEACTQALQAAATWGMVNVQVETDAQNLVKALRGQELDLAPEGVVYPGPALAFQGPSARQKKGPHTVVIEMIFYI